MKPYIPQKLPLANIDWFSLISKIGQANRAIANFNGILNAIANQELLLSPILSKMATNLNSPVVSRFVMSRSE